MELSREVYSKERVGLAWSFRVSPYSCDNPDYYEDYLKFSAITDAISGQAVTHIFIDKAEPRKIAGYIALRATSLASDGENGKLLCHPALEIAELAVDESYEGHRVGTDMVDFSVLTADELRTRVGIRSIVVVADPKAVGFYERYGFTRLSSVYEALHDGWNDNCIPMCIDLYRAV